MTTVARKGVGALLTAYVVLFIVIAAVLAAVLLGQDKNQAVLRLTDSPPAASPARQQQATTTLPKPTPAAPAQVALAPSPSPMPIPAPTPEPTPTPSTSAPAPSPPTPVSAAEPAKPEPAPVPRSETPPAAAAPPSALASLYPPPPPEKPAPPARTAAVSKPEAAPAGKALMPTALLEDGPYGPLPRIAADGRLPWIINNSKFDHGTRLPRLGIVLTGLGLNAQVTEDAIIRLPAEITLAFVPTAENLPRWIALAREFGHEVLIALPMESEGAADASLGTRMLSSKVSAEDNLNRLRWILSRGTGYVGVVTWEGEKFLASPGLATPVLQELALRGLLVVDSRQAKSNIVQFQSEPLGLPFAKSRGFLDTDQGVAALDANLQQLEAIAKRSGFGLAMAVAFPDTVRRLTDWSKTVGQRGFVLAPITGVTECKEFCQQRVTRHAAAVSNARR